MKNIICLILVLTALQICQANPKHPSIPTTVKEYVVLHYPKAKRMHWMLHDNKYVVSLWNNEMHVELCLNENGELLNSIKEISQYNEIPSHIRSKIDFQNLAFAEKLESSTGEQFYILQVNLPKGKIEEYVFDKNGNEIKEYITNDAENKDYLLKF